MLQIILGRSGSGKTHAVRSHLKERAQSDWQKLMLIVPEQASFENERAMLRLLGPEHIRQVNVTSFTRLADEVFRKYGGAAGRRLDDGGRRIFMSLALEQVRDQLEIYRKNAESAELVELMIGISTEFKMCAVSPQDLSAAAEHMQEGTLQHKTKELALILSAYDALVAQSYLDPLDDLTRLKNTLAHQDYFSGAAVAIDSFQSFTVQEYNIIDIILSQAKMVEVALCADRLDDPECGMGLFSLTRRTAKSLIRLAGRNGVSVAPPVVLPAGKRFLSPTLAALEAGIYRPAHTELFEGDCDGAELYEAANFYEEAAYVSASIRRLVMTENYRYRDIAVIARSAESYRGILDAALERWEIPYFMDKPEKIDAEPLMRFLLSAFGAILHGLNSDDIFTCLKTGLAGFSTDGISLLENYTFVWNLSGGRWLNEWTDSPEGFTGEMGERDAKVLKKINDCRKRAVGPLEQLKKRTEEADGEGMAAAAYEFLQETHAAEHLRALAKKLSDEGNPALAERELRIWDLLMQLLDQTALVIGKKKISRSRYAELLHLVISSSRMASIPQGLDEVTVGSADRIRMEEPKVVFLIGAAQGQFPLAPGGNCILSDDDRRELIRLGLPLNDTMEGVAVQERFLAYSTMSAASEKLIISYPAADEEGKANTPSSIPSEACAVLKNLTPKNELLLEHTYFSNAEQPAFELSARKWNSNDSLSATLKALLAKRGFGPRLAAVSRASRRDPVRFEDAARAKALFGDKLRVSATQIEKYHLCRFQYFCRYGINAKERRAAELNALEYGSLMHYLLQKLFQNIGSAKISEMAPQELRCVILGFLNEYTEEKLGGMKNRSARFAYLVSRLADSARIVAAHIARELSQSEFVPADFELEIGNAVGPLRIPLPDGGEVVIDGKIDRVDLMTAGGTRYVRIVDYKTGKKEFRLSDLLYGMNLQMLIYLAALCENGSSRYGEIRPAGVLYMPANRPSISALRGENSAKLRSEEDKQLRMDGLILDSPEVISGMEKKAEGTYIPVALKNGAPGKKEHVVSAEELERLFRYIKDLTAGMARELRRGHVEAVPLSGGYDACSWCPYAVVCGHEKDDPARETEKWDRDAVLKEISGITGKKEGEL